MRKIIFCFKFLFLVILLYSINQKEITYHDTWSEAGFNLNRISGSGVGITFSIDVFSLEDVRINGEDLQSVILPNTFLQNEAGAPNLPGNGRFLALPQGSIASLRIVSSRTEVFHNVELAPAPRIPWDTDEGPLDYSKDLSIYNQDAFYPTDPVVLGEQTMIRGVDAVIVGITPFQYNPVTKELIVYRDIELEVDFIGGNGYFGADNLRSRWWDPILSDTFLNYESLPQMDYNYTNTRNGAEYLIICPNDADFLFWADEIRTFRSEQGISTIIKTTTEVGGNTPTAIENYINDIMTPGTGWDPAPSAILLLGDYGTTGSTVVSPIYNNYCASDNIYADVSGNSMPDVILARMTAQNATHLETMITKFLDYESTPTTDPDFYAHPITALGWQTARWFQICSETVGGFWHNELGKDQVRINAIYSGNPNSDPWSTATNTATVLNVFGPDGLGYIPATPAELGGWTGGNATMVINSINSGAFMLQHRDHGGTTGWGEPDFQSSDINSLTNEDLVYVFSINCLTGKYNMTGECFAEKFHRHTSGGENAGCLGIIAASEVSYSFVNDTFVWGMYDNMWPEFLPTYGTTPAHRGILPAFANAAGKYFLQQSNWPYNTNNKEVTYNLFHHHGDAFTTVHFEVPQNFTVSHTEEYLLYGSSSFDVHVESNGIDFSNALVALSINGSLIGTSDTNISGDATITYDSGAIDPYDEQIAKLVVTSQNMVRYSEDIMTIPGWLSIPELHVYNNESIVKRAVYEIEAPTVNACTIYSGGNAQFVSGGTITLNPGFHALEGSDFNAYIDQSFSENDNSRQIGNHLLVSNRSTINEIPESEEPIEEPLNNDDILVNIPDEYCIFPNYPNPFNPSTTIRYGLPEQSKVELHVYNIRGQLIKTLDSVVHEAGYHEVTWNGDDNNGKTVSSGIYFYKLQTPEFTSIKRMILLK